MCDPKYRVLLASVSQDGLVSVGVVRYACDFSIQEFKASLSYKTLPLKHKEKKTVDIKGHLAGSGKKPVPRVNQIYTEVKGMDWFGVSCVHHMARSRLICKLGIEVGG